MKVGPLLIVTLMGWLCSCQSEVGPNELKRYLDNPDNGLSINISDSVLNFRLSWIPSELQAYRYMLSFPEDSSDRKTLESEYQKSTCFQFIIGFNEAGASALDFIKLNENYVNFKLKDDFKFVDLSNHDTLGCSMMNLEQSSHLKNKLSYELVFPTNLQEVKGDFAILYQGLLTENKEYPFVFSSNDINSIPELKYP